MAVTIGISMALRRYTDGMAAVAAEGATIGTLLRDLAGRYPGLGSRLFESDGSLAGGIGVFVNDEDIRELSGVDTPVAPGDDVVLLPAVAGGEGERV